jgi:cytokinin dehydrogenase
MIARMADAFDGLRAALRGEVSTSPPELRDLAGDFGRIVTRVPAAVVRPATVDDVTALVRMAPREGWTVTSRGAAHSQSGQGLSEGGVLLDMRSLAGDIRIDETRLTAECLAGTRWSDLVAETMRRGLTPLVLTNNLDVTVGGTLSVAGIGVASFRHAAQVDTCEALEVVTGTGERVECDRERERDLFDAVRSGLGLFGVMTRARVRLRRALPSTRTFHLLYDDLATLMRDERTLIDRDRVTYLESWCVPCPQGFRQGPMGLQPFAEWFFPLHVSVEYDGTYPADEDVLDGLRPYRRPHVGDQTTEGYARRLAPLFELWKRAGYWAATHPWMETILPWSAAAPYISQVLANLPPHALGGGHVLLWPSRGRTSDAPLFRTPDDDFVMGFGILPGVPAGFVGEATPRLRMASDLASAMGAKRYLSGYLDFDAARWKAHYGDRWPWMLAMKRRVDPHGLLNPGLLPRD